MARRASAYLALAKAVEFGQRVHGVADARRVVADQFAQFGRDAADFFLFELQLPPGVVEFHRRQRFDEQCRAGAIDRAQCRVACL